LRPVDANKYKESTHKTRFSYKTNDSKNESSITLRRNQNGYHTTKPKPHHRLNFHIHPLIGKLIAVNRRRTYNTMAKKGDKSTNNNLQNITQTTKV
jgi:hypothetical protein